MATNNIQITAGRRFRVNHVPQASGNTAEIEDSNSVPSSCEIDTSSDIDTPNGTVQPSQAPHVEQVNLATPKTARSARPNKRNYNKVNWSAEEKEKILYCFAYSRYEGWGRTKDKVFLEQLDRTDLCKDKLQATNARNLSSLMTQVEHYIPKQE